MERESFTINIEGPILPSQLRALYLPVEVGYVPEETPRFSEQTTVQALGFIALR